MRIVTAGGVLVALAAGSLTLSGCGSSSSTSSASTPAGSVAEGPACDPAGAAATATTATYKMVLDVGEVEQMYMPSDVSASHPTSGEVMLGGEMNDASGPNARHVEIHICQASSGAVVTGASPKIELSDTSASSASPSQLPVSVMQGVTAGTNDYHYGNNATLAIGHSYTVKVTLNGETATMNFTAS